MFGSKEGGDIVLKFRLVLFLLIAASLLAVVGALAGPFGMRDGGL